MSAPVLRTGALTLLVRAPGSDRLLIIRLLAWRDRHRLEHVIFVQRAQRAVMFERVVKDGEVARGEGGGKVRLAREHAVRVRSARLGRVAPLGDLVGLLATWVGGGIGAALLAPPRDADEHALLWLLLVGREDLPCRRLVGSDGPCNEIVRRVYIKRSAGAGAGGRGGKDWTPRTFEQQLCPPRRVGSSALH